jgi:hypothetical protein
VPHDLPVSSVAATACMHRPATRRSALAVSMDVAAPAVAAAPEKINVGAAVVIPTVVVTPITFIDIAPTSRQGRRHDHQYQAEGEVHSICQTSCDFHKELFFEEDFLDGCS